VARGAFLVTTANAEVGFNTESPHWLDVAAFEEVALRTTARPFHGASAKEAAQLEAALSLYAGELLEGHYEEWALAERERLHRLHMDCLVWLMRHHGFYGEYDSAIAFGQEALGLDPAREEVHREVMRLYLETGQRSLANRQFELCRSALQRHLGTEPTSETRALCDGAVRGVGRGEDGAAGRIDGLVERLDAAIRRFDDARDELRRAVDIVLRVSESERKDGVSERRNSLSERSEAPAVRAR
jgi:DNA-binding SARP family transcriptional activator